jgi:hypothetical protein
MSISSDGTNLWCRSTLIKGVQMILTMRMLNLNHIVRRFPWIKLPPAISSLDQILINKLLIPNPHPKPPTFRQKRYGLTGNFIRRNPAPLQYYCLGLILRQ